MISESKTAMKTKKFKLIDGGQPCRGEKRYLTSEELEQILLHRLRALYDSLKRD